MDEKPLTVRQLRRRWKPFKERVQNNDRYQPICIRIHRACSWLQRVEELAEDDLDQRLILLWIGFNSLYGRWDRSRRESEPDGITIREFLSRLSKLDEENRLADLLDDQRNLVLSIFSDDYLADYFWEAGKSSASARHKAGGWYAGENYGMILEKLMDRIYLLRCQLVHGAATCQGKLNRVALRSCSRILDQLVRVFVVIMIDHGAEQVWGPLCYPPLGPKGP